MQHKTLNIEYLQHPIDQLSDIDKKAIRIAKAACDKSYSPFSNFRVAAVALIDNSEYLSAANQESEVFPSGMCAERVLIFNILSNFPDNKILSIYIYSDTKESPCTPCGACRQVIADAQKRQEAPIRVVMCGEHEVIIVENSDMLLPFAFKLNY